MIIHKNFDYVSFRTNQKKIFVVPPYGRPLFDRPVTKQPDTCTYWGTRHHAIARSSNTIKSGLDKRIRSVVYNGNGAVMPLNT